MRNKFIHILILILVFALALTAVLMYVGSERVLTFDLLPEVPEKGRYISLQIAIVGLVLGLITTILVWSLLVWLWRLPQRVKSKMGHKKKAGGMTALEEALLALEAGDARTAIKKAKKAHDILGKDALTSLLLAKAYEANGDVSKAQDIYTALSENETAQAAALRGLARLSRRKGDYKSVLQKAKAAFGGSQTSEWAFADLFDAQIMTADWAGALATLETAEKRKFLEKDEIRRRKTVLLSALADRMDADGNVGDAVTLARRAAELSPGFAPGVAQAARLLARTGDKKTAIRLIEKAWAKSPHPALALAYRDLFLGEAAKIKAKKLRHLAKLNPDHAESHILRAELALEAGDGLAAIKALDPLLQGENTSARLCMLAAQAEEKLGNAIDARAWQIRAASAPSDPDWSDLDPEGPAFAYTDDDWRRLVTTYGEKGLLIHPRFETGARRRALMSVASTPSEAQDEMAEPAKDDDQNTPEAHLPDQSVAKQDKPDLATRLEKLLDRGKD